MVAIRKCKNCGRRFDGVIGKDWRLCPICAGTKNFVGDVTDTDVWEADKRNPCEMQFVKGVDVWPPPNRERAPEHSHYVKVVEGHQGNKPDRYISYKGKERKEGMQICGGKILEISDDLLPPSDWDPSLPEQELLGAQPAPKKKRGKRQPKVLKYEEPQKNVAPKPRSNPYTGMTGGRSLRTSNISDTQNPNPKQKES